jgi:hypothetical protein
MCVLLHKLGMTITSRVFDSTVIKFLGNLHKASQVPVPCTLDMEAGALQVQSQFGLCSETLKKRKLHKVIYHGASGATIRAYLPKHTERNCKKNGRYQAISNGEISQP